MRLRPQERRSRGSVLSAFELRGKWADGRWGSLGMREEPRVGDVGGWVRSLGDPPCCLVEGGMEPLS